MKMSKSFGNAMSPLEMADKYGVEHHCYFLLRDVPFGLDGHFSEESMVKRFNGDLGDDLGNLVYRTLTMIEKYYQGRVPEMDDNRDSRRSEKSREGYHPRLPRLRPRIGMSPLCSQTDTSV